ncbi:unnamed protein product [Symbiodinium natans]|uniref:Uncharacterized protein n=1 Tax=Symbiodinium natans TaxID=878477 RepID=A0A812I6F1_9DINO|nr:unnamed protein product [Symbiodinium natans]
MSIREQLLLVFCLSSILVWVIPLPLRMRTPEVVDWEAAELILSSGNMSSGSVLNIQPDEEDIVWLRAADLLREHSPAAYRIWVGLDPWPTPCKASLRGSCGGPSVHLRAGVGQLVWEFGLLLLLAASLATPRVKPIACCPPPPFVPLPAPPSSAKRAPPAHSPPAHAPPLPPPSSQEASPVPPAGAPPRVLILRPGPLQHLPRQQPQLLHSTRSQPHAQIPQGC